MSKRSSSHKKIQLPDGGYISLYHWEGHGRPLVLIHGFMDSARGWSNLARVTHRPCYAIDLPGFGGSSIPAEGCVEAYAQRVLWVMDRLNLQGVTLVGHSLGGAVAKTCATLEPEGAIDSLALITPAGFGKIPLADLANHPLVKPVVSTALPLAMANPLLTDAVYRVQVSGGHAAPRGLLRSAARTALRGPAGPRKGLEAIVKMNRDHPHPLLQESSFTGPVASLWGQKDRLIPRKHADAVQQVFPHAKVSVWEDLAHHPQVEQPERLFHYIEHSASKGRKRRKNQRSAQRHSRYSSAE